MDLRIHVDRHGRPYIKVNTKNLNLARDANISFPDACREIYQYVKSHDKVCSRELQNLLRTEIEDNLKFVVYQDDDDNTSPTGMVRLLDQYTMGDDAETVYCIGKLVRYTAGPYPTRLYLLGFVRRDHPMVVLGRHLNPGESIQIGYRREVFPCTVFPANIVKFDVPRVPNEEELFDESQIMAGKPSANSLYVFHGDPPKDMSIHVADMWQAIRERIWFMVRGRKAPWKRVNRVYDTERFVVHFLATVFCLDDELTDWYVTSYLEWVERAVTRLNTWRKRMGILRDNGITNEVDWKQCQFYEGGLMGLLGSYIEEQMYKYMRELARPFFTNPANMQSINPVLLQLRQRAYGYYEWLIRREEEQDSVCASGINYGLEQDEENDLMEDLLDDQDEGDQDEFPGVQEAEEVRAEDVEDPEPDSEGEGDTLDDEVMAMEDSEEEDEEDDVM